MMWVMSMPQLEAGIRPNDENGPEEPKISYPPSSVFAIGVLKNAIGRSWFLEVGFYYRISKSQKVLNIEVSVPETNRDENVKPPAVDCLVSIQSTLASILTYEEIANIKLESVVYIAMTNGPTTPYSSPKAGKSKCQICDERGSPMKKVKFGPAPSVSAVCGSKGSGAIL
ncbi:hypothetical protein FRC08_007026 [Ceratobasidium sp. 394]|nr:hypothetical protein FRC08_007026 [Ceratobasidium sp. 394]KAG9085405.1 hypothetical protein FS749_004449 [Ceratobasidium sp. UAMH 11750]